MENKSVIFCPSSECKEDSILLGIVQSDGHVIFQNKRQTIDKEFVSIARSGRSPEKRFRLASECVKESCKQWTGKDCGIIEEIIRIFGNDEAPAELPECPIRSQCRWFSQCGGKACSVCPEVIMNLNSEPDACSMLTP